MNTGNYAYGGFYGGDFSCRCYNEKTVNGNLVIEGCNNPIGSDTNNCWWGYQIIETSTTGKVTTYHVTTERTYTITGQGQIAVPYSKTTEIVLK